MFLKQIYCSENTTCFSIQLEKRKVFKKAVLGPHPVITLFHFFIPGLVLWYFWPLIQDAWVYLESSYLWIIPLSIIIFILMYISILLVYQGFYYRYYFYDINDKNVVIRKGVISRTEVTISYNRIQNVFVDQDFWDRILGLYDVHIATADFQSADVAHIDGVNAASAEILKNELIKRVQIAHQNQGL